MSDSKYILNTAYKWLHKMAGYTIFFNSKEKPSKRLLITEQGESERIERDVYITIIGDYMVDPERNLIYDGEQFKQVSSKLMGLLMCLVRYEGHVVSKAEISVEAWPDGILYFNEITTLIIQLRAIFQDDAKSSKYIKTVGHKGYCLTVPTKKVSFGVFASQY